MLGKVDGVVRLIAHDVNVLIKNGKIKSVKEVLKGPKLVIKKKMSLIQRIRHARSTTKCVCERRHLDTSPRLSSTSTPIGHHHQ